MKADHTAESIAQTVGKDSILSENLESFEDSTETEIAFETLYNQKKCKEEFQSEKRCRGTTSRKTLDMIFNKYQTDISPDV